MFYVYNPVVGGLIPGGPDGDKANAALAAVRNSVGDTEWKAGNTLRRPGGVTELARAALAGVGITPANLTGVLKSVGLAQTNDSRGNTYHKVRVALANQGQSDTMISVDVDTEVGERLIQKLDQAQPGQVLEISAFAMPAADSRPYVNHVVSVKTDGQEVSNTKGIYERIKAKGEQVRAALASAGITDGATVKTAVNKAKDGESLEIHRQMVQVIAARFPKPAQPGAQPREAAQAEPA